MPDLNSVKDPIGDNRSRRKSKINPNPYSVSWHESFWKTNPISSQWFTKINKNNP
jgi:hypothetical protein